MLVMLPQLTPIVLLLRASELILHPLPELKIRERHLRINWVIVRSFG
jgi:hypothetical protein